jgi:hypothetical protein
VACSYLATCPGDADVGHPLVEAALAAVDPTTSERLARRLLRACDRFGLVSLRRSIALVRGAHLLRRGSVADAVRWMSKAGDGAALARTASQIVERKVREVALEQNGLDFGGHGVGGGGGGGGGGGRGGGGAVVSLLKRLWMS